MKRLTLHIKVLIFICFTQISVFGACGVVWSGVATGNGSNWGVGATQYTIGFAVEHGGTEYTVKAIPGFNCAPDDATWGTTYWNTIGACGTPPSMSATTGAGSITCNSATGGGTVDNDGNGSGISERGLAYHTATGPVITDNKKLEGGTTTGTFSALMITGLTPGVTYYVRLYATNGSALTGYGTEFSFTAGALPTVAATTVASSISASSATTGGNVTALGACTIAERGVV